MFTELNMADWPRKDHFDFFRKFEEPFFGITAEVDVTKLHEKSKQENLSFFLMYLHLSLKAANEIAPFRYRIEEDKVLVYEQVHASPTINRPDGTFGFSYMTFCENFNDFSALAQKEIERVRGTKGLEPSVAGQNVIHYSALPWISFKSLSHARSFSFDDSCPKISMGKMTLKHKRQVMPVSVHVHHALMDGFHVGQFLECYQELINF